MVHRNSIKAYRRLERQDKISEKERFALEWVAAVGPCTARELHAELLEANDPAVRTKAENSGVNLIRPELTRLRKEKDMLVKVESRECAVSGNTAMAVGIADKYDPDSDGSLPDPTQATGSDGPRAEENAGGNVGVQKSDTQTADREGDGIDGGIDAVATGSSDSGPVQDGRGSPGESVRK